MSAKFEPILTLQIRSFGPKEFVTWQSVRDWAQSEVRIWESWTTSRPRIIDVWKNECVSPMNQLAALANECIDQEPPADFEARLNKIRDVFANGPAIVSDSVEGRRILWYLSLGKNQEAAIYAGAYINKKNFNLHELSNNPHDFIVPLIAVAAFESVQDATWDDVQARNTETFKGVLDALQDRADQKLQSFDRAAEKLDGRTAQIKKGADQVWKIVRKAANDATSRRIALEETYEQKLRLAAPAGYWRDRARSTKNASFCAIGAFVFLLSALAALGLCFGTSLKGFLSDKDGKVELAAVALVAPVFIVILGLFRIIGRSYMINQQHAMECRQRETMMSTFLALTNDQSGKITDAERLIVLQALFRPSGINSEVESIPSNMLEVAATAFKGAKS